MGLPKPWALAPLALMWTQALSPNPPQAAGPTPEQIEFFEKRIRPVLVRSCYPCHSAAMKSPMGELRVDTRDGLLRGGKSGAAIAPGSPDRSPLYQALLHAGPLKMPPSAKLAEEEIADFANWIKMGAPDPRSEAAQAGAKKSDSDPRRFWSFQPVADPPVPKVKRQDWVKSTVDAFLLARLEAKGLDPAPPADRATLLRRVTYDLIGLPPTPEEVAAFVNDESPDAFARVVDRLLASPHYGERWGRHWLDLVRYAETNGHEYDNDKLDPWRYRDYVIRAFNQDLPYDQFVREHIAGDLLPKQRLASDGASLESPLGTTFYWFGEVLNSATDSVKSRADEVDNQIDVAGKAFLGLTVACARCHDHKFDPIPTADYYALAGVLHSTDIQESAIDSPERARRIAEISREIRNIDARIAEIAGAKPRLVLPTVRYRPEDVVFENFENGFGTWRASGAAFAEGPEHGMATSLAAGSKKFVGTLTSAKFNTTEKLFLHVRLAGSKGDRTLKERGQLRFTIVADGYKGQHIVPDGSGKAGWQTLRLTFERNRICYFEIVDRDRDGYIAVDRIVFSDHKEPPPTEEAPAAQGTVQSLDPAAAAEIEKLTERRRKLEEQIPESAFAMQACDYKPHNVQLHIRGSHQNLGEEVPRGFLRLIAGENPPPIQDGSGRLKVAEWIASSENPLTARVMVNRIWRHHFGSGIVRSTDNFGATGDPPTHPELLDYLASRFVESGWSVKAMHRLMLLSSAYRMSSRPADAAKQADPENKLLHHFPVRRLEGEAIRDAMLAVSGRLDPTLYGPSVPPHISKYQDGRGKPASGPLDGKGRRSIYIQVRRNFLTPFFLAFDYPLPISTIGARSSSTVPSQALLLLNNEFIAQQARQWAARTIAARKDPQERIEFMYRAAFSRAPDARETEELLRFIRAASKPDEEVWSDVAHVLFNTPEFIYVR
ncbi:MAG: PSD1 and planctomycete cytochrome C domain-containing protein [Bryobacteraceae bacterium]